MGLFILQRAFKNVNINSTKVSCRNCKYYREFNTPYERSRLCILYMFASTAEQPEIKYIEADYCRNNESLCGPDAKYFKLK
jgi:hypothetical protein